MEPGPSHPHFLGVDLVTVGLCFCFLVSVFMVMLIWTQYLVFLSLVCFSLSEPLPLIARKNRVTPAQMFVFGDLTQAWSVCNSRQIGQLNSLERSAVYSSSGACLRTSVVTSFRQADRSWARRFAVANPRFIGCRSASTVLSQDCLGRPILRLHL